MDLDDEKDDKAKGQVEDNEDEFEVVEEPPRKRDDKRLRDKDEDDDEDEEDDAKAEGEEEPEADAEADAERERIREQRRLEKRERRAAQKAARERDRAYIQSLEAQVNEFKQRLGGVENQFAQQRAAEVDQRMAYEAQRFAQAEAAIKDATTRGDGELLARALRQRDDAVLKHRDLQAVKQRVVAPPPQQQEAQKPSLDPRAANYAREFMERHGWYNPQASDDDSAVLTALDNKVAADGFDPKSEDYWKELEKRASKILPHRFGSTTSTARKGPPTTSTREHVPASTRKQVYISPERKKALQDSGDWDDPVRRNKMLKYYEQYDKQNPSR